MTARQLFGLYVLQGLSPLAICLAVQQWRSHLERRPVGRPMCGNAFLGTVALPVELGMFGLAVLLHSHWRILGNRECRWWWWMAVIGILTTPLAVGVLIFVVAFAGLMMPAAKVFLNGSAGLLRWLMAWFLARV